MQERVQNVVKVDIKKNKNQLDLPSGKRPKRTEDVLLRRYPPTVELYGQVDEETAT